MTSSIFFTKTPMTSDQLTILSQEITRLYSVQANSVTQMFPPDLWLRIFKSYTDDTLISATEIEEEQNYFRQFLSYRTVSKQWLSTISKMEPNFVNPNNLYNPFIIQRVMSLWTFSYVRLDDGVQIEDLSPLANATDLFLSKDCIPAPELAKLADLTQLTSLTLESRLRDDGDTLLPEEILLALTNLRSLAFYGGAVSSLTTLTNLEKLELICETLMTPEDLLCLTKLTSIKTFSSLRPRSMPSGGLVTLVDLWEYSGEWKEGKRDGKGKCRWYSHRGSHTYDGTWADDRPHGVGKLSTLWDFHTSYYHGDLYAGKRTGKGERVFKNGDRYQGSWVRGKRFGQGTYTFHDGSVYTGEFQDGEINGFGRCVYANGDMYHGNWINGAKSGDGVYKFAATGNQIETQWPLPELNDAIRNVMTVDSEDEREGNDEVLHFENLGDQFL